MDGVRGPRRLAALLVAGTIDSLCLSVAWTVVIVDVTTRHGLAASGLCGAAMMLGIALSAPVATRWSRRLDGRHLLRSAALVEVSLRLLVFLLLFADAPVWLLALAVCVMNVMAWTGYAGMRAEVAAVRPGSAALTWYGTMVASVEAAGVALVAWLPGVERIGPDTMHLCVLAAYLLALVPTAVVAGGSTVPRAVAEPAPAADPVRRRVRVSRPVAAGTLLMFFASAPTLLSVALAVQLHGRSAIGPAAIAFTVGSLAAPTFNGWLEQRQLNRPLTWVLCALGMTALWVAAAQSVAMLCLAQLSAGLCMTALEGMLDATVARLNPTAVTGALARATAGRALGSAAGTAVLPFFVAGAGIGRTTGTISLLLLGTAVLLALTRRRSLGVFAPAADGVATAALVGPEASVVSGSRAA
jgi:hypothetical protein